MLVKVCALLFSTASKNEMIVAVEIAKLYLNMTLKLGCRMSFQQ
jgi:hypothetical protein